MGKKKIKAQLNEKEKEIKSLEQEVKKSIQVIISHLPTPDRYLVLIIYIFI